MARSAVMAGADEGAASPPAPARPAPRRGLPLGLTPRRLVEIAYVALLGFLIVRLVWAVVTPIEAPDMDAVGAAPRIEADLGVFERFDPFGAAVPSDAPPEASYAGAAETTLDLRLVGVTVGGGVGTAIIALPDGNQKSFLVGEEIIGGVSLRDVLPNQAILNRNGLTETLTLKDRDGRVVGDARGGPRDLSASRVGAAPATGPGPSVSGPLTPGQALDGLSRSFYFEPTGDGFALAPGTEPYLFNASGFAPGDIVTAVDGMAAPQDPERLLELMADLPPGRPFTVTVERDGVPLDVPVDLGALQ